MKRFILIGHPVGHSISPAIHGAAYAALGLSEHEYAAVDCPNVAAVERQVERLRAGELSGANVTVPWKRVALELSDDASPLARRTGAANVLRRVAGEAGVRIVAENTDVAALGAELSSARPGAKRALVIGNGGAALAAAVACGSIGVGEVFVVARRWSARSDPESWARADEFRALGATPIAWPLDDQTGVTHFRSVVAQTDLVVQSTSAGMKGADPGSAVSDIIPWDALPVSAFVYDLVYNPPSTAILEAAASRGIAASGGLGMLVGQAEKALELWLGVPAPAIAMRAAAERALFGEGR